MAHFEVKVVRVDGAENHPNADRLSLIKIAGYSVISAKLDDGSHRYKPGDLVVYVPENALVPEWLLKQGFWDEKKGKGFLAGPLGNRVKPIKLRDILSEGILFPVDNQKDAILSRPKDDGTFEGMFVDEGDDVAEFLGIVKWEPEIPANMAGDLFGYSEALKYDIENIKKYNRVIAPGELVYITEKLHGTFGEFGWMRKNKDDRLFDGEFFAASKGLGAKGLVFKDTPENRANNLYVRALLENIEKFRKLGEFFANDEKIVFFGEIFGKGVQDLNYNVQKPQLRIFDIWADGRFLDFGDLVRICDYAELPMVPILYVGPFSEEILARETKGTTKINGAHIREGAVVKPLTEREDRNIGRVILKSVSEDYLSRKGAQTEYQ